jgi:glutaredoxin
MRKRRDQAGRRLGRHMLPGLLCLFAGFSAHLPAAAQVYKWTDAQGTVHYTDTPPPQQRASEIRTPQGASGQNGGQGALPYELARAVKASPVTLYTTTQSGCPGCDQGRLLLRARGIPYTEKTVDTDDDKAQLRRLAGRLELPLLVVGSRKLTGFQDAAWQEALSSAAYPRSAQLPSGYQFAAPEPAAPASVPAPPPRAKKAPPPDEAAARAAEQQPRHPAEKSGNAPPGFQF